MKSTWEQSLSGWNLLAYIVLQQSDGILQQCQPPYPCGPRVIIYGALYGQLQDYLQDMSSISSYYSLPNTRKKEWSSLHCFMPACPIG